MAAAAVKRRAAPARPAGMRRLEQVFLASEPRVELRVFAGAEDLALAAAAEFLARARTAVAQRGRFIVALPGGSTPNRFYAHLAGWRRAGTGRIPWGKIHVFWGDERLVPPGHPDSNFRAVNDALLVHVPIPQANVHRIRTEGRSPAGAAALYEQEIRTFFRLARRAAPRFDLVVLGLGADGHTASLFPGSEALAEDARLVAAPLVAKLGTHRITVTLPVLNNARTIMFLVSGGQKSEALARALHGGAGERGPPRPGWCARGTARCSGWWTARRPSFRDASLGQTRPTGAGSTQVELDALGERQVGRPVDRVGLAAHVGLPRVGAGLAAAAGLLLAAERAADLGAGGADVDVGDAAVGALVREERLGRQEVGR